MWYRTKDTKKFGKDKIPKNRNCKKFGYSWGKEKRKEERKILKYVKNCLIHEVPLDPYKYHWYIQTAKKELGLDEYRYTVSYYVSWSWFNAYKNAWITRKEFRYTTHASINECVDEVIRLKAFRTVEDIIIYDNLLKEQVN